MSSSCDSETVEYARAAIYRSAVGLAADPLNEFEHMRMLQALSLADKARVAAGRLAARHRLVAPGVDSGESAQLRLNPHRLSRAASGVMK